MGEDSGEKTEEPTPHKLREGRKKGQIAKSKEITGALLLIVSFYTFKAVAASMWEQLITISNFTYQMIPVEFTYATVGLVLKEALKACLFVMLPLLLANFIGAIIIEAVQTGFLFSMDPLIPKLEKINPIEGFKKFFSIKNYVELIKSVIKMALIIWLLYDAVKSEFIMVLIAQEMSLWQIMAFTGKIVMKVVTRLAILYFIIAIFDYFYQRYEYMKEMRMSKKEIKDEYKRLEGDPMIKQRQREVSRQMAQGRQMGSVPGADVVVTNPIHFAVAIRYKHNKMRAPVVVAKGQHAVALEIKRIAEEHHIPIVENPPLAQSLYHSTEVNGEVPFPHYRAVAEILAFVYNLKKKRQHRY